MFKMVIWMMSLKVTFFTADDIQEVVNAIDN